jgi:hypothetical protein
VPGHLAGTENRCPTPPAAYADQQQLSHHLHEWLEAALLQHANLNTASTPQVSQLTLAVHPEHPEEAITSTSQTAYTPSNVNATLDAGDGDWEHVQDAAATDLTALPTSTPPASSRSSAEVSVSSATDSLEELEVPFAGLMDAAMLLRRSNLDGKPSDSSSSSGLDIGQVFDNLSTVVILQDAVVPLESPELQNDNNSNQNSSSSSSSSSHDDDWSVLSGGSS